MSESNSIIAVYETRADSEAGIRELQRAPCSLKILSVLGKEDPSVTEATDLAHFDGRVKQQDRAVSVGSALPDVVGDAAFYAIPDIGPLRIAGPLTATIQTVLQNVSGEASSPLGVLLSRAGIPEACIAHYETELKADKFLLIACGTSNEVMQARDILRITRPSEISIHFDIEKAFIDPVPAKSKTRTAQGWENKRWEDKQLTSAEE
jgi:hypothetical protein